MRCVPAAIRFITGTGANNPEEKRAAELAAYDCDFFLASTNASREDGVMVNVDGYANRVSAIAAGPRTVLMIVGMNKVGKACGRCVFQGEK